MFPRLTLVIGGAASGKSAYAEQLVCASNRDRAYIATARPLDAEMQAKIARHKTLRGDGWTTFEAYENLPEIIAKLDQTSVALLDCATMWLTNQMMAGAALEPGPLKEALAVAPCPIVTVTNELGQGLVPDHAVSRKFREAHGRMNQTLAAQADLVVLVTAGLPQILKGKLP